MLGSLETLRLVWEHEIRLHGGVYRPLFSHSSPVPGPLDTFYDIRYRGMRAEQESNSEEPADKRRILRMVSDSTTGKSWFESVEVRVDASQSSD